MYIYIIRTLYIFSLIIVGVLHYCLNDTSFLVLPFVCMYVFILFVSLLVFIL
jgi:hypothetical protein